MVSHAINGAVDELGSVEIPVAVGDATYGAAEAEGERLVIGSLDDTHGVARQVEVIEQIGNQGIRAYPRIEMGFVVG
jgi:hypothetical protein